MKQQLPHISSSKAIKGWDSSSLAKSETNDCVVLSIASAFSVSYEEAHEFVKNTFKRKFRKGTIRFVSTLTKYAETKGELIDTSISYWLVGSDWDGKDQTRRFIDDGIWENGYSDRFIDVVKSVKPGDKIAIKSTYTRKRREDIPFDNKGNAVSVMAISMAEEILSA